MNHFTRTVCGWVLQVGRETYSRNINIGRETYKKELYIGTET